MAFWFEYNLLCPTMNLAQIKRELEAIRVTDGFPTDQAWAYAAHLLQDAYEIGIESGVDFRYVGRLCSPAQALLEVNRLIAAMPVGEYLNVPQAAKLLGVAQSKIAEFIRAGRLEATNVGQRGKRPQWRIHREALRAIKPETAVASRRFKPPMEII